MDGVLILWFVNDTILVNPTNETLRINPKIYILGEQYLHATHKRAYIDVHVFVNNGITKVELYTSHENLNGRITQHLSVASIIVASK